MSQILESPDLRCLHADDLPLDHRRYLADLLIARLREDRWELRIDRTMTPIESPGEAPGFSSVGVGKNDPRGSSHVLRFTAERAYELGIEYRYFVMLGSDAFDHWCRYEAFYTHWPHLERLTHGLRPDARVFRQGLSGYGTCKRVKMRRNESVTKEQADAALEALRVCIICILPT